MGPHLALNLADELSFQVGHFLRLVYMRSARLQTCHVHFVSVKMKKTECVFDLRGKRTPVKTAPYYQSAAVEQRVQIIKTNSTVHVGQFILQT